VPRDDTDGYVVVDGLVLLDDALRTEQHLPPESFALLLLGDTHYVKATVLTRDQFEHYLSQHHAA